MACRCAEIQKCEQDIRLLESELAQELNYAQRYCGQGTVAMPALSGNLTSAAFVSNVARMDMRLAAIKKNQDGRLSNSISKRSSEVARLRSLLTRHDNEDRRYHEIREQQAKI